MQPSNNSSADHPSSSSRVSAKRKSFSTSTKDTASESQSLLKRQRVAYLLSPSKQENIMRDSLEIVSMHDVDFGRPSTFQPHTGVRKLVVKNVRRTPRGSLDDHYERISNHLEEALTSIFSNRRPRQALERLYRDVEELCRNNQSEGLYRKLKDRCEYYLRNDLLPPIIFQIQIPHNNLGTLRSVQRSWNMWTSQSVRSLDALIPA